MPNVIIDWLAEHVAVPAGTDAHQLAADLVRVGLEEEQVIEPDITGPLVVGRVLSLEKEEHSNGKTISWCIVDVGEHNPPGEAGRGIVCGAHNFAAGDAVVVALSGAVLPGGFEISARKTYGHISDGMICSARELGIGEDHAGIIVLGADAPAAGTDALAMLGLADEVLEINVTPDRGYCFSVRGVAREYHHSTGAAFTDPGLPAQAPPADSGDGFAVQVNDDAPIHGAQGCDRFVARIVRGVNPDAPTPGWMARRLRQAGMRPISVVVDITNYVMLDLGQPLHAYDLATLTAPIVVRRAKAGEKLTTLDDAKRKLDAGDLLITDDGGARPIGLAGVMGGAQTEVSGATSDVLVEAAHFDPISIARTARRHKLPSEAAKRFERGVDPALQAVAAQAVVDLLIAHAGGTADDRVTDLDNTSAPAPITLPASEPTRLVGVQYTEEQVADTLTSLGATVSGQGTGTLQVVPPTWRPDLIGSAELVEEVVRLRGYDQVPSVLPKAPGGRGLTLDQRRRRRIAQMLADTGLVQVLTYPFVAAERDDEFGFDADDSRRLRMRLANPLAENQPYLRSTLLHTLVDAAVRNVGRGMTDVALYEVGLVTQGATQRLTSALPPLGQVPSDDELASVHQAVPDQPRHAAGIFAGNATVPGVHSPARRADYTDAIAAVRRIANVLGLDARIEAGDVAPWHPGRCAVFRTESGAILGYAGELAPKVVSALGLPARTVAFEVDLDAMFAAADDEPVQYGTLSTFPAAKEDIALVGPADVPAARVLETVKEAAGELAEDVRLFDRYSGESIGADEVSLAFALRLRAPDRTLTAAETAEVRQAVVELSSGRHGARLRD